MAAIPIALNVSARQFTERDLFADVIAALARHRVNGSMLELELTESTLMENTALAIKRLQGLREVGGGSPLTTLEPSSPVYPP